MNEGRQPARARTRAAAGTVLAVTVTLAALGSIGSSSAFADRADAGLPASPTWLRRMLETAPPLANLPRGPVLNRLNRTIAN